MSDLHVLLVGYGAWAGFFLVLGLVSTWVHERRGRRRTGPAVPNHALRARLKRLARPTLLLVPAKSPGFSKLGGLPELPADALWPEGPEGPLTFVGQLDLEAFQPHGGFNWLPESGRIYMFFDEALNGAADCGKVLFSRDPPGPPRSAPNGLPNNRRFAERRVGFMRFTSVPSPDWLGEDLPGQGLDWEHWRFAQAVDFGDEIDSRVGGYPSEIQSGQMGVECEYLWREGPLRDFHDPAPENIRFAARQWRLLLQVDSDPSLGMNWWDAGRLYVFIRARDAKSGDFSKTVTITQSY